MTLTVHIFCHNEIFTLLDPDAATVMGADPIHYRYNYCSVADPGSDAFLIPGPKIRIEDGKKIWINILLSQIILPRA
jgi:hypothetical protein